jgi:hypothetical protein
MGAAINSLPQTDIAAADQVPFFSSANGSDRKTSVTQLSTAIQALLVGTGMVTQYSAPSATGFSVTIAPPTNGVSMWLLLTPAATYAAGTIVLPAASSCIDGQEVAVTCTQIVSSLTVSGNGATVNGAPTALTANQAFRLRFDGVFGAWYPIT